MRRYRLLATPLVVAWFWALPAAAQQRPVPLDTVRVSALSRAAAGVAAGTRSVQVITAEEIRRSPARSVAELLQWAANVDVMPRSPALVDVAVRGSSFEQVLLLVDGVRASDSQTGHFDLNLAVPLDQIDRIEIVRGPGSALHGGDAMGGVIHIVTRRGGGPAARAEVGSFGTTNLAASHSLGGARAGGDMAVELLRSDGHRPGTDYETAAARVAVATELGGRVLSADVGYSSRDFGADGFYGPFPSYERTRTTTATLRSRGSRRSALSLEPALSLRRHTDDFILRRADPSLYRNQHETLQAGGELTGRYAGSSGVHLGGGLEAYADRLKSARLGNREERRAAIFGEVVAGGVGSLTATTGLRLDWHESFGTFWSPSAATAWSPSPRVRLRGSVGRSFRTPTWTERYYRDPANVGDPDLRPERAWSAEIGGDVHPLAAVRFGGAAFLRRAADLIDWARPLANPAAPWQTGNVETATYRGLELSAVADDLLGIRLGVNGSWLSLESNEAPGFTSKYALRPMAESVTLSVDRVVSRGVTATLRAQRARRLGQEAYGRFDARGAYELGSGRLYVEAQNGLDERYPDITGASAPGRALLIGLQWGRVR